MQHKLIDHIQTRNEMADMYLPGEFKSSGKYDGRAGDLQIKAQWGYEVMRMTEILNSFERLNKYNPNGKMDGNNSYEEANMMLMTEEFEKNENFTWDHYDEVCNKLMKDYKEYSKSELLKFEKWLTMVKFRVRNRMANQNLPPGYKLRRDRVGDTRNTEAGFKWEEERKEKIMVSLRRLIADKRKAAGDPTGIGELFKVIPSYVLGCIDEKEKAEVSGLYRQYEDNDTGDREDFLQMVRGYRQMFEKHWWKAERDNLEDYRWWVLAQVKARNAVTSRSWPDAYRMSKLRLRDEEGLSLEERYKQEMEKFDSLHEGMEKCRGKKEEKKESFLPKSFKPVTKKELETYKEIGEETKDNEGARDYATWELKTRNDEANKQLPPELRPKGGDPDDGDEVEPNWEHELNRMERIIQSFEKLQEKKGEKEQEGKETGDLREPSEAERMVEQSSKEFLKTAPAEGPFSMSDVVRRSKEILKSYHDHWKKVEHKDRLAMIVSAVARNHFLNEHLLEGKRIPRRQDGRTLEEIWKFELERMCRLFQEYRNIMQGGRSTESTTRHQYEEEVRMHGDATLADAEDLLKAINQEKPFSVADFKRSAKLEVKIFTDAWNTVKDDNEKAVLINNLQVRSSIADANLPDSIQIGATMKKKSGVQGLEAKWQYDMNKMQEIINRYGMVPDEEKPLEEDEEAIKAFVKEIEGRERMTIDSFLADAGTWLKDTRHAISWMVSEERKKEILHYLKAYLRVANQYLPLDLKVTLKPPAVLPLKEDLEWNLGVLEKAKNSYEKYRELTLIISPAELLVSQSIQKLKEQIPTWQNFIPSEFVRLGEARIQSHQKGWEEAEDDGTREVRLVALAVKNDCLNEELPEKHRILRRTDGNTMEEIWNWEIDRLRKLTKELEKVITMEDGEVPTVEERIADMKRRKSFRPEVYVQEGADMLRVNKDAWENGKDINDYIRTILLVNQIAENEIANEMLPKEKQIERSGEGLSLQEKWLYETEGANKLIQRYRRIIYSADIPEMPTLEELLMRTRESLHACKAMWKVAKDRKEKNRMVENIQKRNDISDRNMPTGYKAKGPYTGKRTLGVDDRWQYEMDRMAHTINEYERLIEDHEKMKEKAEEGSLSPEELAAHGEETIKSYQKTWNRDKDTGIAPVLVQHIRERNDQNEEGMLGE